MPKSYSKEFKESIVTLASQGHSVNSLAKKYNLSNATITRWINRNKTVKIGKKEISYDKYIKFVSKKEQTTNFSDLLLNCVTDSLSSDLNCSYEELSSSIDNLLRLGIISKKNSELVEWRWRPTKDWFKSNKAISEAYDSINKEKDRLENEIYKVNHPKTEIRHENGKEAHYTVATVPSSDLVSDLERAKNKKVNVNHDRCVILTSLGKDFTKVCL